MQCVLREVKETETGFGFELILVLNMLRRIMVIDLVQSEILSPENKRENMFIILNWFLSEGF